jgi:GH15 family glucan-1,4-alpha-glucosidase
MSKRIEDYAIIGDGQTAGLVARDGSIDWLCFRRFDAAPCFASLLGTEDNGFFKLAPKGHVASTKRRYRDGTLVLETDFETSEGAVTVVDFMPLRGRRRPHLIRLVVGKRGQVAMQMKLVLRFDYGSILPWVRSRDHELRATGGSEAVRLITPVEVRGEDLTSVAEFTVGEGERVPFVLSWHFSYEDPPQPIDPVEALDKTEAKWRAWSSKCERDGAYAEPILRSLITLKALANERTGGIVAAPTTSLPEEVGGVRNWDYRFCWVRDATFTLLALVHAGYTEEAVAWREWLLRAVAGNPAELQIMYGIGGERRLTELELSWLSGYEGSKPVRTGNAACDQFQLDVFGEIIGCLYQCQKHGLPADDAAWDLELSLLQVLERKWHEPDEGIWEVRGGRKHFTHSKMMAWVAFDRAIKTVEGFGMAGPVDRWREARQAIFDEVCTKGLDPARGAFTQCYGSKDLDAALLIMPLVGFLPATDERVRRTIEAIQRELVVDGFVMRYTVQGTVDGVSGGEGAFLPCSLWLSDCLTLLGRVDEAREMFERVLAVRNDVGLLSEEYDPKKRRLLGNFPQALTHVSLILTALNLARASATASQGAGAEGWADKGPVVGPGALPRSEAHSSRGPLAGSAETPRSAR